MDANASFSDLYNAISERPPKADGTLLCLTANDQFVCLNDTAVSSILWAIGSQITEAAALFEDMHQLIVANLKREAGEP